MSEEAAPPPAASPPAEQPPGEGEEASLPPYKSPCMDLSEFPLKADYFEVRSQGGASRLPLLRALCCRACTWRPTLRRRSRELTTSGRSQASRSSVSASPTRRASRLPWKRSKGLVMRKTTRNCSNKADSHYNETLASYIL